MDHSKMKYVYEIRGKGLRKFWYKIGVAFENRDGSLNCKLESLPIGGELHIRDAVVRDSEASSERIAAWVTPSQKARFEALAESRAVVMSRLIVELLERLAAWLEARRETVIELGERE